MSDSNVNKPIKTREQRNNYRIPTYIKLIKIEAEDFPAVAWQHEMEHLSGHVFIENLSVTKRKKFEKDWKKEMKNKK